MIDLTKLLAIKRSPESKRAQVTVTISWATTDEGEQQGVKIMEALSKMLSEILTPEEQREFRRQLNAEQVRVMRRRLEAEALGKKPARAKRATPRRVARKAGGAK